MLRRIRTVLVTLCLILFFFVALIAVTQPSICPFEFISKHGVRVAESISPTVQGVVLIVALGMLLVIGALAVQSLREQVYITKETEEGSVTILEPAISRYIRQIAMDIDSVQSVRAQLTNTREGIVVDLFARVLVINSLPKIEQLIRTRVRAGLEETLGVGSVAAINVVIEGFQKAESTGPAAAEATTVEPVETPAEETGERWSRIFPRPSPKVNDVEDKSEPETPEPEQPEEEDRP
jgi:uncharacterized alkaline shock family protein YloU